MSSLSAKDRVSLCMFSFADGRRCRAPRTGKNPHFCFDHAQKEARARTAETLGKDLAYFFSGDYLSACDLSTALGRLIPAVLRGDVKPRTARTVAYLAQTLLQTIRVSQDEHINAFGTNGWRQSIRNSVNDNHDYLFPPAPKPNPAPEPQPPAPHPTVPTVGALNVAAGLQPGPLSAAPHVQPTPSTHTPLPPKAAEFAQHVMMSGLSRSVRPGSTGKTGEKSSSPNSQPASPPSQPAASTANPTPPTPATHPSPPPAPAPQPACPEQGRTVHPTQSRPSTPQSGPSRDTPWWEFGEAGRIPPDSKLL